LGNLTLEFSHIGVDSIVTLGRLQGEVRAVKKVLQARNSDVKIKSFSQNSETRNAYMYLKSTPDKLDTGQKILVGNVTEMQLQTILDIYEGTDTVIVKPTESTHLITLTTLLIDDKNRVLNFLTSNKVKEILKGNHHSRQQVTDILQNMDSFNAKCGQIKVGGYTVSGTYYLQKKLQEEKGDIFAFNVVDELLKNSISAAGDHLDAIIDRNALWYLKMKKS
jgi:delta-aminolevulinic acid dehydratase/porphobilinogen synthase